MVSTTFWLMKLMATFVLLCTFIQINNSQPVLDDDDDNGYDRTKIALLFATNYLASLGRFPSYRHDRIINDLQNLDHDISAGESINGDKQFHSDSLPLTKRVIMLPRVGRR